MKAAILTIGDELMIGQIVDSNSSWIASWLDLNGWQVTRKIGVRDDIDQIIDGVRLCTESADLIITTGGLGPTKDDLTKDALCQYFDCPKEWHEETWQRVKSILARFNREATELHKEQCYLPSCAEIIPNDHGSAPGLLFEFDNKWLVSVPGVPHEMRHLLSEKIINRIPAGSPVLHSFIRTCGEGETVIAERIADIEQALPQEIKLAYLPAFNQVTLRLTSYHVEQQILLHAITDQIIQRLGSLVYGTGNITLAESIGKLLRANDYSIGLAESCTGGFISHMLTTVPGSSDYFIGSVIPYAYRAKTSELGIAEDTLLKYGAVSREVVTLMAESVRRKLGVTWSIASSGVAGPGGGTPEKPVGTIWIACSGPHGTKTKLLRLTSDRGGNIESTAIASLVLLRACLLGHF